MPNEPVSSLQLDEELRDAYSYFIEALVALAAEPEVQCESMGDYNVSWEIKDDVAAGRCLAGWSRLTPHQRNSILTLVAELDSVPPDALKAAQGRTANLNAMRNEAWVPLRKQAAELLGALSSFTETNNSYLAKGA